MTAATLTSGHDDWPGKPSLTLSYGRTRSRPGRGSQRHMRQRRHNMEGAAWQRREVGGGSQE